MNGILQFLGRRLIGFDQTFRIGFEIDIDFTLGGNIPGLAIVFKIGAIYLIEAGGIMSVEGDHHIV